MTENNAVFILKRRLSLLKETLAKKQAIIDSLVREKKEMKDLYNSTENSYMSYQLENKKLKEEVAKLKSENEDLKQRYEKLNRMYTNAITRVGQLVIERFDITDETITRVYDFDDASERSKHEYNKINNSESFNKLKYEMNKMYKNMDKYSASKFKGGYNKDSEV